MIFNRRLRRTLQRLVAKRALKIREQETGLAIYRVLFKGADGKAYSAHSIWNDMREVQSELANEKKRLATTTEELHKAKLIESDLARLVAEYKAKILECGE